MKKWLKTVIILVAILLVVAAVWFFVLPLLSGQGSSTTGNVSVSEYTVQTGTIVKTISGTGDMQYRTKQSQKADSDVTISKVLVSVGDKVNVGDKLAEFDDAALFATISTLSDDINTLKSSMDSITTKLSSAGSVSAGVSGRIKAVYFKVGSQFEQVISEYGALALVSLDGYMCTKIPAGDLKAMQKVSIKINGKGSYSAYVSNIDGGTATVLYSDKLSKPGDGITVFVNKVIVGTAVAQVHSPYLLTSTYTGVVSNKYIAFNDTVSRRTKIAYIKYQTPGSDYAKLAEELLHKEAAYKKAVALRSSKGIYATTGGIIATIPEEAALTKGAQLFETYKDGVLDFVAQIDELDISSVRLGQDATLKFDSMTDKDFTGKVTAIAEIGAANSGVTTYDVTMSVNETENLRSYMNGTATITVDEATDVIVIPLTALQTTNNGSMVIIKVTDAGFSEMPVDAPADGEKFVNRQVDGDKFVSRQVDGGQVTTDTPGRPGRAFSIVIGSGDSALTYTGVRTQVKTGLSDDTNVEVVTGLSVGDVILIVTTTSTTSSGSGQGNNMMFMGAPTQVIGGGGGARFTTSVDNNRQGGKG